jgi:hypothetical protein
MAREVTVKIRDEHNGSRRRRNKKKSNAALILIIMLVLLALLWARQRQAGRVIIPQGISNSR